MEFLRAPPVARRSLRVPAERTFTLFGRGPARGPGAAPEFVGNAGRFEQLKTTLESHRELCRRRVEQALEWAGQAQPGQSWQTDTDLRESDQADIYLTRE